MRIQLKRGKRIGIILNALVVETVQVFVFKQLRRFPVVVAMRDGVKVISFVAVQIVKLELKRIAQSENRDSILTVLNKANGFDIIGRRDFFFNLSKSRDR
jgi:hypothetical protein